MERMKIEKVKKVARTMIEMYPDKFTSDFEKNKEVLRELFEISSKGLRNQIAGYIAHLLKGEKS